MCRNCMQNWAELCIKMCRFWWLSTCKIVQNLYVNGAKFVCKTAQNLCVKLCRIMCKTVQNCVTLSDMAHVKYFLMHYCVHIISGET